MTSESGRLVQFLKNPFPIVELRNTSIALIWPNATNIYQCKYVTGLAYSHQLKNGTKKPLINKIQEAAVDRLFDGNMVFVNGCSTAWEVLCFLIILSYLFPESFILWWPIILLRKTILYHFTCPLNYHCDSRMADAICEWKILLAVTISEIMNC